MVLTNNKINKLIRIKNCSQQEVSPNRCFPKGSIRSTLIFHQNRQEFPIKVNEVSKQHQRQQLTNHY